MNESNDLGNDLTSLSPVRLNDTTCPAPHDDRSDLSPSQASRLWCIDCIPEVLWKQKLYLVSPTKLSLSD